jgi:hypothetical protein
MRGTVIALDHMAADRWRAIRGRGYPRGGVIYISKTLSGRGRDLTILPF